MKRAHDPIIFQNSPDGIDLSTHFVAGYYPSDALPGVDFIDHFPLLESMAIASVMEGVPIAGFARRSPNRAHEKWGTIERPKTPWLRVAPAFHPSPSCSRSTKAGKGGRKERDCGSTGHHAQDE